MTLVELTAAVAIAAIIIVPLSGILNQLIFLPEQWSASMDAVGDARAAVRSIAADARQASVFTPAAEPDYGAFTWTDRAAYPTTTYAVRYRYSAADAALLREETAGGVTRTRLVADGIEAYADVSIRGDDGLIQVSVTTTKDAIRDRVTRNDTVSVQMRPASPPADQSPPADRLAWDDFESGGLAGGSGWLRRWSAQGAVTVPLGGPYEGTYHLWIWRGSGRAERSLDLSGRQNVRLRFWVKTDDFEAGDAVSLLVSSDGVDFTAVRTWGAGGPDNVYRFEDVDLSSFPMTSQLHIAFQADMTTLFDRFFVDNLRVVGSWEP